MKKWILSASLFTGLCVFVSSCIKNNSSSVPAIDCSAVTTTAPAAEVAALQQYLDTNKIIYVKDSHGFFYKMDSAVAVDSGTHATVCSGIAVTYKGTLLNGVVFGEQDSAIGFSLYGTIAGWEEAIPLMRRNATMTLYLPPSLAYGAAGASPSIPGNSDLIFTIKLYDFTN